MHAEIQFDGDKGQYEIIDRGSQNGTFINDQRIAEVSLINSEKYMYISCIISLISLMMQNI